MRNKIEAFLRGHVQRIEYQSFNETERETARWRAVMFLRTLLGRDPDPEDPRMVAAAGEQTVYLLLHPDAEDTAPRARRYIRAITEGETLSVSECFGKCRRDADCSVCELGASCRYVTDTEPKMIQHSGMISVEEIEGWSRQLSTEAYTPGGGEEPERSGKPGEPPPADMVPLSEFCQFIFSLDEYTLGILAEIITPHGEGVRNCTVSDLARIHKCSRQAMHRKMLASVRRYPELASTFALVLRKVAKARAAFVRDEDAPPVILGSENCNNDED